MSDDVPEELINEIPDPIYIHVAWENDDSLPTFSFGGMTHYEFLGRLVEFTDDIRHGTWVPVEEEDK